MTDERTLANLHERVDTTNTDDVWGDGYDVGWDDGWGQAWQAARALNPLIEKDLADELVELRRHMADRPNMTIDAATHEAALARHLACEQAWRAVVAETANCVRGLT